MQRLTSWSTPKLPETAPRWGALLLALGALGVLGIYTLSDPALLARDHLLEGADYAGYAICHRITERSFTIAGRQMPLCARCTGIYLGISAVFTVLLLAGRGRRVDLPPARILLPLLALVGFMGVDGVNSYSHFFPNAPHLYEPQNWLRLLTGMGTGLAIGTIIFPALVQVLWWEQDDRPVLTSLTELLGLLLLGLLLVALVLSNQPTLLYVLSLVSAAGLIAILTGLNTIFLLVLLRRDARARHHWQVALPLLVGLLLATVEISAVAATRYYFTGTMTGLPGL